MGQTSPGTPDLATAVMGGSFTGIAASAWVELHGLFNVSLSGFGTGQVQLQRSFDGGLTPLNVGAAYADNVEDKSENEPEAGVLYRLDCTNFTAGPIIYRLSQ